MKYAVEIGQSDGDGGTEWHEVDRFATYVEALRRKARCESAGMRFVVFRVVTIS